jgi:hypothetical protein
MGNNEEEKWRRKWKKEKEKEAKEEEEEEVGMLFHELVNMNMSKWAWRE